MLKKILISITSHLHDEIKNNTKARILRVIILVYYSES